MPAPPLKPGDRITEGVLYRRIPCWHGYFDYDANRAERRAFEKESDELSLSLYLKDRTTTDEVLTRGDGSRYPGFGICEVDASDILEIGKTVGGLRLKYDPEPGPAGEAHVGLWGPLDKKTRDKIAMKSRCVERPAPPMDPRTWKEQNPLRSSNT